MAINFSVQYIKHQLRPYRYPIVVNKALDYVSNIFPDEIPLNIVNGCGPINYTWRRVIPNSIMGVDITLACLVHDVLVYAYRHRALPNNVIPSNIDHICEDVAAQILRKELYHKGWRGKLKYRIARSIIRLYRWSCRKFRWESK